MEAVGSGVECSGVEWSAGSVQALRVGSVGIDRIVYQCVYVSVSVPVNVGVYLCRMLYVDRMFSEGDG